MAEQGPAADTRRPLTEAEAQAARGEVRRFRNTVGGLSVALAVLAGTYVLLERSQEYDPTVAGGRVVLYAVLILNIVLLLAILVTIFRNVFKLFYEWRRDLLGSRFSTKLVLAFLLQGIVPVALLFLAGSELIRISTARWFSTDVDAVTEGALRIAARHRAEMDAAVRAKAIDLAADLGKEGLFELDRRSELPAALRERMTSYQLAGLTAFLPGAAPVSAADPRVLSARLPDIPDAIVMRWQRGDKLVKRQETAGRKGVFAWAGAPVLGEDDDVLGVIAVLMPIDTGVEREEALIQSAREEYKRREVSKGFLVATNVSILLLVTLLLLFASVWMGIVMARGITVPIQRLAEGMAAVSGGKLDHRVEAPAADELRMLVDTFNRMTAELAASELALERSVEELRRSNEALAERRTFIETILEDLAAAVITFDRAGALTTYNPTAARLLRIGAESRGKGIEEVLGGERLKGLRALVSATLGGLGAQQQEVSLLMGASERIIQALATPLLHPGDSSLNGAVLVLEDVTDLIRAEKASAWREVARRMAHEIKNPLTPIQLSAERILGKAQAVPEGSAGSEAIQDGARIILEEVRTLKSLVDEFSRFARLPQVALRPTNLNEVVGSAAALYEPVLPAERLALELEPSLPLLPLDPEQLKRAIVNLVDNALAAMGPAGKVTIRTLLDRARNLACLEVLDEGPGVPVADRPKLFLPYFSTKKRGTGLGLAIVDRVVSDHGGYIRVEDNAPRGARFVIEIPLRGALVAPVEVSAS
ncbi:MAG: ATP-binding protein [Acidobacteriota bacterium]